MKPLAIALIFIPGLASAHVGHVADAAGHDHWVAGAALAAAAAIALWGALKGKKAEASKDEPADEQEPQEA